MEVNIKSPNRIVFKFFNCNSERKLNGFIGDVYPHLKPENRKEEFNKKIIQDIGDDDIIILFELDNYFLNKIYLFTMA